MPFNFDSQNPVYTFGFGGKYPKFTEKKQAVQAPEVATPFFEPLKSVSTAHKPATSQVPSYNPNKTPSDLFNQYKPREATGMEQLRGIYGNRGLSSGYLSGFELPTYSATGYNPSGRTPNQVGGGW